MDTLLPGTPYFHYQKNQLWLENVCLETLAKKHGTPLYVYSKHAITDAIEQYKNAFEGYDHLICFALKANSNLAILQLMVQAGCGFDIVSGGELARVLAAGARAEKVIFSGVGKTKAEMRQALEAGIQCFNVESAAELEVLSQVAQELNTCAPISFRINPDVDAKTHPYISTGLKDNKFGIAHQDALAIYLRAAQLPGIKIIGIDCHIGSQITESAPYLDALDRLLDLVVQLRQNGISISHIDLGGGLGIAYQDETPPSPQELYQQVLSRIQAHGLGECKLLVEPGRSLVGNAGVLITEVLYLKETDAKNFCIIDGAMNDLMRPALYESYHHIVPLKQMEANARSETYDVVGPICESSDWLGRDRNLCVQQGDLLAILSAGAYGMTMSSNYNTRPRAAEVLVDGDQAYLIKDRETIEQLFAGEHLLKA